MLVDVEGCGVCGSNLPVWEGRDWFAYPLAPGAPGHEAWGVVSAAGPGVSLAVGTRVAMLAENAFATRVVVPERLCVPFSFGGPFPGEALGCGFNVAAKAAFAPGQTVCVVGAGFLGCVVVAVAAHAGAHVTAVSRRPVALDLARAMGAKEAVTYDEPVPECDVVVEVVGNQQALDYSSAHVRQGGRLVIAGFHQDGLRTVDLCAWNWRALDIANAHERDENVRLDGIRAAAAAVEAGWLDPSPLYTHTFGLDGLGAAMDAMVERPDGFLKALVTS